MSASRTIGVTGAVLLGLVAVLVGASIYLADTHTELLYMLIERMDSSSSSSDGVELHGHWNGIGLAPVSSRRAASVGVPPHDRRGVAVVDLDPRGGAGARNAGLRVGDVIVGVDQTPIANLAEMHRKSLELTPGAPVLLDVRRQGQLMSFAVPIGIAPDMGVPTAFAGPVAGGPQFCPRDGVLVTAEQAAQSPACPVCGGPLLSYPPGGGGGR